MYSSYSFTTSALDGGEQSASRPGRALPPGKGPQVPIGQESGWAAEPVWTQRLEEKSFASAHITVFILLNKKFWQELISLLSPHKLTVNNLVTMEHKQSKPIAEQGSPNKVEHQSILNY
jgi:hypothetical protein